MKAIEKIRSRLIINHKEYIGNKYYDDCFIIRETIKEECNVDLDLYECFKIWSYISEERKSEWLEVDQLNIRLNIEDFIKGKI